MRVTLLLAFLCAVVVALSLMVPAEAMLTIINPRRPGTANRRRRRNPTHHNGNSKGRKPQLGKRRMGADKKTKQQLWSLD